MSKQDALQTELHKMKLAALNEELAKITAQLDALKIERTSHGNEPVSVSGWYANQDGTMTRYDWRNGRLYEGWTVDATAFAEYEALNTKASELCERIHWIEQDMAAPQQRGQA